ncbi:MAG TPA: methyltransferase [Candidatus Thermoplasmatota archaeon]
MAGDRPVDGMAASARTPEAAVEAALGAPWGSVLRRGWERYGDVVVLQFLGAAPDAARRTAAAAVGKALGARAVVEDFGVRPGPTRAPRTRRLWGGDTRCVHREGGVAFAFDPMKVMFASGNQAERARMGALDCRGETVVDLFAGIGYLSVPLAARARAARVVACEVNPDAHAFLLENVRLNKVEAVVEAVLGDCREVAPRAVADRVLMGFVHGTAAFLPTALGCLKPAGGVVHFHEAYPQETKFADARRALAEAAGDRWSVDIVGAREVKSFAPGIDHIVVDARFTPAA